MSCLGLAGRLCVVLTLAGCAAPPSAVPAADARLHLVNMASASWSVTLAPKAGGPTCNEVIPPGAKHSVSVPPGPYEVEQTLLDAAGHPVAARRFAAAFAKGVTYEWPLATLLSLGAVSVPYEP